jgi:cation transport ATPase
LSVDELYDNNTLFWVLVQEIQRRDKSLKYAKNNNNDQDVIQEWKQDLSSSHDMGSSSVDTMQPQGQLQQLEHFNQHPSPPLPASNAPPRLGSYDHDANDRVRQEQRHAQRILIMMERQERDRRKRQRCKQSLLWSTVVLLWLAVMGYLVIVFQVAWMVLWLFLLILVSLGFLICVAGIPCSNEALSGTLGGALNRV